MKKKNKRDGRIKENLHIGILGSGDGDITAAKIKLLNNLIEGEYCPCCAQRAQVYRWSILGSMVQALVQLYKLSMNAESGEYFHHSRFRQHGNAHANMRHWGLIEEKRKDENDKSDARCSGMWRITGKGVDYLFNRIKVPEHIWVYDNRFVCFDGDDLLIIENRSRNFNYFEMMSPFGLIPKSPDYQPELF